MFFTGPEHSVMEMFRIMTVGIKAINLRELSITDHLTRHTVIHCCCISPASVMVSLKVYLLLSSCQKGVKSDEQADHLTSPTCLLHLSEYNVVCQFLISLLSHSLS